MDTVKKLFWAAALLAAASSVRAFTPAAVALAAPIAAETASNITMPAALNNLYNIPANALGVLYLPLGVAEVAASPLPGFTVSGGTHNIARGVTAPIRVIQNAVMLPVNLIP